MINHDWPQMARGAITRLMERKRPDLLPELSRLDLHELFVVIDPDMPLGRVTDTLIERLDRQREKGASQ